MEHINNNKQDAYRRRVLPALNPQSHFSAKWIFVYSGLGNNSYISELSYSWFRLARVILVSLVSGQFRVDMWPNSGQWDLSGRTLANSHWKTESSVQQPGRNWILPLAMRVSLEMGLLLVGLWDDSSPDTWTAACERPWTRTTQLSHTWISDTLLDDKYLLF